MAGRFQAFVAESDEHKQQLFRLRYQVFVEEQGKYRGIADHARKRLVDELDDVAVHVCVERDGQLVASLRQVRGGQLVPEAWRRRFGFDRFDGYELEQMGFCGRLLVLPEHRRSRALLYAVDLVYRGARKAGLTLDFIHCDPYLVRLYEQLGYRRHRPAYFDPELGFQVPLVHLLDDGPHLRAVRSPFQLACRDLGETDGRSAWFAARFPEYRGPVAPVAIGGVEFVEHLSRSANTPDPPLLRGLQEGEVKELLAWAGRARVPAGSRVVRQGEVGTELFVLIDGVAEVRRNTHDGPLLLATLGKGDAFGEVAVLTSRLRSADVVATTDLELASLDQGLLRQLVADSPALASKLLLNLSQILAERLEESAARVA